jgi:hypothetical protein
VQIQRLRNSSCMHAMWLSAAFLDSQLSQLGTCQGPSAAAAPAALCSMALVQQYRELVSVSAASQCCCTAVVNPAL